MFKFVEKTINAVKTPTFKRCMDEVDYRIKSAWKFIKRAEDEYEQGNIEDSPKCIRVAKEDLLEAFKHLKLATSSVNMPKNDPYASRRVVETIMELCDHNMYDILLPKFIFEYEFKYEHIQKEWEEEVSVSCSYARRLIQYEESIREHPNSSRLKNHNKNSVQG